MQHRSAREMSATPDQNDILHQFESFAPPELDAVIRLPDPLGIVGVDINRHVPERPAPIDKRRVEMRMRNGDGAKPAKPVDDGNGGVIDQRDAIPQDVAFRRTQQQCALANGEFWASCLCRSGPARTDGIRCGGKFEVVAALSMTVPQGGMNWRSSSHTGQWSGGPSLGGYWVPQVEQMKAGMFSPVGTRQNCQTTIAGNEPRKKAVLLALQRGMGLQR